MKLNLNSSRSILRPALGLALICFVPLAAFATTLWDLGVPAPTNGVPSDRSAWKAVPTELFAFEANPGKASSDPGYSGREYYFTGDAAVENQGLLAVFSKTRGTVSLYAKSGTDAKAARLIAEAVPLGIKQGGPMSRVSIVRNAGDEVVLEVTYASAGESAQFSFARNEIVELKPTGKLKSLRVLSALDYGVVPGFLGDDLIYDPAAFPESKTVAVPSENIFVGLQAGGDRMLVVTWPKGHQQIQLGLGGAEGKRRIESLDLQGDGQSFYLASLTAPGIWHRETMKAGFLEKDVTLDWKRPFPAKWKTQLSEYV
ncbi:MAG: hypothetical protein EB034_23765, partial [Verrucomicrobia bacterium]|nr:hypothetical protein [Verrucomicrobiota bacterium]